MMRNSSAKVDVDRNVIIGAVLGAVGGFLIETLLCIASVTSFFLLMLFLPASGPAYIPDGKYVAEEHYDPHPSIDWTSYCIYRYEYVEKMPEKYATVEDEDIDKIKGYFSDFAESLGSDDEFVFDESAVSKGDYYIIIDKYYTDDPYQLYSVWFFDVESMTLYFLDNNK